MYTYKQVKVKAPLLEGNDRFILNIDNHQEIMEALADFARRQKIQSGVVEGIGAISEATFRFLDPATKQYMDKTFQEQMEITNLTGNISRKDGDVYLHLHITASRRDYTCVGGHLLTARISGACELVVEDFWDCREIGRQFDEETGLNLYKF